MSFSNKPLCFEDKLIQDMGKLSDYGISKNKQINNIT